MVDQNVDVESVDVALPHHLTELRCVRHKQGRGDPLGDLGPVVDAALEASGGAVGPEVDLRAHRSHEALDDASMLRELTTLPGRPTVFVLCHPTKTAQREGLLPRGGGAFISGSYLLPRRTTEQDRRFYDPLKVLHVLAKDEFLKGLSEFVIFIEPR